MEKVGPELIRYHIVQSRMIIERTRIIYQQVIYYLLSLYTDYLRTVHEESFFFWAKVRGAWTLFPVADGGSFILSPMRTYCPFVVMLMRAFSCY